MSIEEEKYASINLNEELKSLFEDNKYKKNITNFIVVGFWEDYYNDLNISEDEKNELWFKKLVNSTNLALLNVSILI